MGIIRVTIWVIGIIISNLLSAPDPPSKLDDTILRNHKVHKEPKP